jgi:sulfur-oxidizing protein SoxZ
MAKNKLKAKARKGVIDVKAIIKHKMETGLRKDKKGNVIPADHLTSVIVAHNGTNVVTSDIGGAVSKDPYFRFQIKGNKGDEIKLSFVDNNGKSGELVAKSR